MDLKNFELAPFYALDEEWALLTAGVKKLGILGSKSGRNLDKVALTKLNPEFLENTTSFKEAKLTIVCKKIYFQDLDINNIDIRSIPQSEVDRFYKEEPMHRMYIGEVMDIIDRRRNQWVK